MLCVKPTDDKILEQSVISGCKIKGGQPRLITAVENNQVLGYICVDPTGTVLNIAGFNITGCENYNNPTNGQREIADYLIRSAGNYAFNRYMLTMECEIREFFSLFKLFGFTEIDNKLTIHLKVLFKKCENCS